MSSVPSNTNIDRKVGTGRVLVVIGTRPEAIKMAPVISELRQASQIELKVCLTAQHREMLDRVVELFGIQADYDLNVMTPGQTLTGVTVNVLEGMMRVIEDARPDFVLVHGDTTTTFSSSLAAFYAGARIAHVEAGLRTGNLQAPWPEEANRRLTGVLADLHFAPTDTARQNLLNEGVDPSRVVVTGNTVVDALLQTCQKLNDDGSLRADFDRQFGFLRPDRKMLLVTGHRRENFGEGFERLCRALARLSGEEDIDIVYPVHLNPNVREPVLRSLGQRRNVHLLEPVDYLPFVYLMSRSDVILTDSGGIQEEAPSLGKPVLVTRASTERPEGIAAGTSALVGTDERAIVEGVKQALHGDRAHTTVLPAANPYGDGRASARIAQSLLVAMHPRS